MRTPMNQPARLRSISGGKPILLVPSGQLHSQHQGLGCPPGPSNTRDRTAPGCCCQALLGWGRASSARLAASCLLLLRVTRLNFTKPPQGLLTLNFRV